MMKYLLTLLFLFPVIVGIQGQIISPEEKTVITYHSKKTKIRAKKSGELLICISTADSLRFENNGHVRYSDFGARGNGKKDDIKAIAATHAYANRSGLRVKADEGATYYIGGKELTVIIQTDTDFGTATFLIDDTRVKNRSAHIFQVSSGLQAFRE